MSTAASEGHRPSSSSEKRRSAGPPWQRAIRHGAVLSGLLFGIYVFVVMAPDHRSMGVDAYAYWLVEVPGTYDIPHRSAGSFPYTPPIALLMDPFGLLPFWQFLWLWTALLVGSLIWIGRSLSWILVALAIPFVTVELYLGNIHILLAVAVLLGRRHPWMWAFVLLTKTSCGVGLLWFAVRREWRSLFIALGATAAVAAISFVLVPGLWRDWFAYVNEARSIDESLWNNVVHIPLSIRLVAAVVVVVWGARTDRYWTVLVAVTLSLPVLWMHGFAILVGLVAELRRHEQSMPRHGEGSEASEQPALTG